MLTFFVQYFFCGSDYPLIFNYIYRVFNKYCGFFLKFLKFFGLLPFSVFPRCQCVYTHQAGRTPALQQNWQSSEKSQRFKEKTQYLMNTMYLMKKEKVDRFCDKESQQWWIFSVHNIQGARNLRYMYIYIFCLLHSVTENDPWPIILIRVVLQVLKLQWEYNKMLQENLKNA